MLIIIQHVTKQCSDLNSRKKVCNQFQYFVPWGLFKWLNVPVTLESMALRTFLCNYVHVFPYYSFTNFNHAALNVNKELKGRQLLAWIHQLAAVWGQLLVIQFTSLHVIPHRFTNDTPTWWSLNEGSISLNQQLLCK